MTYEAAETGSLLEPRLLAILAEIQDQDEVGKTFPPDLMSFLETKKNIREFIEIGGEYGLAYEFLVSMLESNDFKISGPVAVKLLEVGLLMGYKTESPEDALFDNRQQV
jgi:hypothetical protein